MALIFETVWYTQEEGEYPFPVLRELSHINVDNTSEFAGGAGLPYDPYLIADTSHLNQIRKYPDAYFKMTSDIVFTEADFAENGEFYNDNQGWVPIESFTGNFEGNGHTITGLLCHSSGELAGLFGVNKGHIQNLGMLDGDISIVHDSNFSCYAGGIAAKNEGSIFHCYNTCSVKVTNNYGSLAIAGGIAGENSSNNDGSKISDCYNSGDITAISIQNSAWSGGIVGRNGKPIANCYNIGEIRSTAPNHSYFGGIVGEYYFTVISDCYYLNNTSKGVGDGIDTTVSCTADQMKQQSTFVGFDFDTIWEIDGYHDYPYPQLKSNRQEPIRSIELLTPPTSAQLIEGLLPDLSGATVKILYEDGFEISTDVTAQMLSELDIDQLGIQTVHLTYGGKTTAETIDIEVIPKSIISIAVTTPPAKPPTCRGSR